MENKWKNSQKNRGRGKLETIERFHEKTEKAECTKCTVMRVLNILFFRQPLFQVSSQGTLIWSTSWSESPDPAAGPQVQVSGGRPGTRDSDRAAATAAADRGRCGGTGAYAPPDHHDHDKWSRHRRYSEHAVTRNARSQARWRVSVPPPLHSAPPGPELSQHHVTRRRAGPSVPGPLRTRDSDSGGANYVPSEWSRLGKSLAR